MERAADARVIGRARLRLRWLTMDVPMTFASALAIEQISMQSPATARSPRRRRMHCIARPTSRLARSVARRAPDRAEHEEAKPDQKRFLPAGSGPTRDRRSIGPRQRSQEAEIVDVMAALDHVQVGRHGRQRGQEDVALTAFPLQRTHKSPRWRPLLIYLCSLSARGPESPRLDL